MDGAGRYLHRWGPDSRRLRRGRATDLEEGGENERQRELTEETALRLSSTLVIAFDVRDAGSTVAAHSGRVARIAGRVSEALGLPRAATETVTRAAQLHEIGMIAVSPELLARAGPLDDGELARVRDQARVGSEIVRATHDPLTSRLVAWQYADFAALRRSGEAEDGELLLAGILRVADVLDAVANPRPYQDPMERVRRTELLLSGTGTRFHPVAARCGLELLR
jgi:response regulator RpfG family c-di-GMP phosphodiesterase